MPAGHMGGCDGAGGLRSFRMPRFIFADIFAAEYV
jgi:hypothetical protein